MCNICGTNCGRGGPLLKHLTKHQVDYETYQRCFYPARVNILADTWDDSVSTKSGDTAMCHVLVRRIVGDPGSRGVTRDARR